MDNLNDLLTKHERQELIDLLKDWRLDHMFRDGFEDEYVLNGFPADKGLNQMTDEELLLELGHYDPMVDTTIEQIADVWKRELSEV